MGGAAKQRSKTEWTTPQEVFDKLNEEFSFKWDLCASIDNAKCPKFLYTEVSLDADWSNLGTCFLNPPYGRGIEIWLSKAASCCQHGSRIVAIIPARTNAPWWHDIVMKASQVRFVRKKMPYSDGGGSTGVPSWGSAIVVFEKSEKSTLYSSWSRPPRRAKW